MRFYYLGTSKNLAPLVFRVPNFIFWLKEGVLSMSYMLFFAIPSFRLPSHWVFRSAHLYLLAIFVSISWAGQPVNINTADAMQLASALDGVGEKKAEQIVAWRQQHGAFQSLHDLSKVPGMSVKLIERNRQWLLLKDQPGMAPVRGGHVSDDGVSLPQRAYGSQR
jgi:competence protein ComEA